MTENEDYAILTDRLTKKYKSKTRKPGGLVSFFSKEQRIVTALNNVNLKIRRGELFGLLGRNGAGKTTLVKVLCTLLPPDEGTAIVNGFDVKKQQMQVKQSIGTIFSVGERGFFWRLTGYSNLEFYSAINNVPRQGRKERIMEVLDLVGMKEYAFEVFQKYSGGMKRKLALARAILPDPPVLLLDEPTAGLDVISSRTIREFIKNELTKKSQKTILYTTHYIEEAAQICDRIAILQKGQVVAVDTPDKLKILAKSREVIEVVLKNISDSQIDTMRGLNGVVGLTPQPYGPGEWRLRIHLEKSDVLENIFDFLFGEKIKIIKFRHEEPTLEDAFIELTGKGISE